VPNDGLLVLARGSSFRVAGAAEPSPQARCRFRLRLSHKSVLSGGFKLGQLDLTSRHRRLMNLTKSRRYVTKINRAKTPFTTRSHVGLDVPNNASPVNTTAVQHNHRSSHRPTGGPAVNQRTTRCHRPTDAGFQWAGLIHHRQVIVPRTDQWSPKAARPLLPHGGYATSATNPTCSVPALPAS
jgi:hypothetical protein